MSTEVIFKNLVFKELLISFLFFLNISLSVHQQPFHNPLFHSVPVIAGGLASVQRPFPGWKHFLKQKKLFDFLAN